MVELIKNLNYFVFVLFFCCYVYQIVYVFIRFIKRFPKMTALKQHRFAFLIPARNESQVIGELINSIWAQNYPRELIDVYVVADNCTDDTAQVAREHGAVVFERFNNEKKGKGYALNHGFGRINEICGIEYYDAFMIFDADNILDEDYVKEMNAVFDSGYGIVTSYRNSKNFGTNWISAGYALWFLRESKYLNGSRMICNTSCAISGTGFLVSSEIIKKDNGWKYNLLTEDIEFSVDKIIHGNVIGYCETAIFYDEQPVNFKTSWDQRLRWAKGFYQVMQHYGMGLLKGCFRGRRFQCFDMLMTIAPASLLSLSILLINFGALGYGISVDSRMIVRTAMIGITESLFKIYLSLFFFGAITVLTEWKRIYCSTGKKLLYAVTFPIFMLTYIPISIVALFKKVTWKPIQHTIVGKVTEIRR